MCLYLKYKCWIYVYTNVPDGRENQYLKFCWGRYYQFYSDICYVSVDTILSSHGKMSWIIGVQTGHDHRYQTDRKLFCVHFVVISHACTGDIGGEVLSPTVELSTGFNDHKEAFD